MWLKILSENKAKENVVFSADGNTVEFEQRSNFQFSPELSGDLTDEDEVTMLNAALMVYKRLCSILTVG